MFPTKMYIFAIVELYFTDDDNDEIAKDEISTTYQ